MTALLWLLFLLCLALALIGPKRWFRGVQAPLLRNPAANEPSEAGYALAGAANWIATGFLGIVAVTSTGLPFASYSAQDTEDAVREIVSEIDGDTTEGFLGPTVEGAAAARGHDDELLITEQPREDGDPYRYTITNDEGEHPFCVTTDTDYWELGEFLEDVERSAEYEDGAC